MPDPSLRELMHVALDAAVLAGKRTLAYFNAGVAVEDKPDDTPVTVADREAEDVCRSVIAKYYPTHTITGEERSDHKGNDDFTWIIDPIDGTKSFVHGAPLYGVLDRLPGPRPAERGGDLPAGAGRSCLRRRRRGLLLERPADGVLESDAD